MWVECPRRPVVGPLAVDLVPGQVHAAADVEDRDDQAVDDDV
jgi:hypothetical protein